MNNKIQGSYGPRSYNVPARAREREEKQQDKAFANTPTAARTDTVSLSKTEGAAYYDSLRQKFGCVKNGSVSIAGSYLDQCAKDPTQAKRLEESLAAYSNCLRQGYENAQSAAQAAGGKLLHYGQSWSIDGNGGLTITSWGTVEYGAETKTWQESRQDTLENMAKMGAKKEEPSPIAGEEETVSQQSGGKVAVNVDKRARQIAAAKCQSQVQQVIALLRQDMADCKAGLSKGWCDESEIAKVQALLNSAQARMNQVPREAEEEPGLSEFDMAGLM